MIIGEENSVSPLQSIYEEVEDLKKDLVVFRCEACAKDLENYNPYIYSNGKSIPVEKIEVVKVPKEYCENDEQNFHRPHQLQAPIELEGSPAEPWIVKYWGEPWEREKGDSRIFGYYENFEAAYSEGIRAARLNDWACCEIQLQTSDTVYTIYCHATTEPIADEFIKN